jgi:type VII secretion protein EccB
VQTRRDQLHAYRFLTRRAVAALVGGEPNAVEPPMRRLTATTISGIMIAVLAAVGVLVYGLISPKAGSSWKHDGAIVVERETGARYVVLQGVLHPVLNYASAVLASGARGSVAVTLVDRSDLAGSPRGATIGIAGLPDSLPPASGLVSGAWTACSRESQDAAGRLQVRTALSIGAPVPATPLDGDAGVLVAAPGRATDYLLWHGRSLRIGSPSVLAELSYQGAAALPVANSFLGALPAGPDLAAPQIAAVGSRPSFGQAPGVVGQLVRTEKGDYWLVLRDGVHKVDAVQAALLATLRFPGRQPHLGAASASDALMISLPPSQSGWQAVDAQLTGLPTAPPRLDTRPAADGGLCARFADGASTAALALPPPSLANPGFGAPQDSPRSQHGLADIVTVPPGAAAMVRGIDNPGDPSAQNNPKTVFVVAAPGERFAAASTAALAGFGYAAATPVRMPAEVLALVPAGPALDPAAARQPVPAR